MKSRAKLQDKVHNHFPLCSDGTLLNAHKAGLHPQKIKTENLKFRTDLPDQAMYDWLVTQYSDSGVFFWLQIAKKNSNQKHKIL